MQVNVVHSQCKVQPVWPRALSYHAGQSGQLLGHWLCLGSLSLSPVISITEDIQRALESSGPPMPLSEQGRNRCVGRATKQREHIQSVCCDWLAGPRWDCGTSNCLAVLRLLTMAVHFTLQPPELPGHVNRRWLLCGWLAGSIAWLAGSLCDTA